MNRRTVIAGSMGLVCSLALSLPQMLTASASSMKSGGRAVAHKAGGKPVNDHSGPTARAYSLEVQAGEPTLGITEDGDVFYTAIQTNTRNEVLRSSDDGQSWEIVSPKLPNGRNAHALSVDPYLFVDEDTSRVFTIDLTVACSYLSFTDDAGASWTTNPLACGRPINDHQTLFGGPPALSPMPVYPNVLYYCWNDIATSSCTKSLDGGVTFAPTGSPAFTAPKPDEEGEDPQSKSCGGLHGHGFVGADGTVFLPRGYCGQPWLAYSKDEGLTWTRVQVANNGVSNHEAGVATDDKGNIYYTWTGLDRLPYLAISRDDGETWTRPLMIGAPGVNESNLPGIAVGAPGKVAIVYMGTKNSPGFPFPEPKPQSPMPICDTQLPCPDPPEYAKTTWNGYMVVSANALDKNPTFYSSTVNPIDDPLKRGTCGPGRCGSTILDFVDIVISPKGEAWAAFVDNCTLACPQKGGSGTGNLAIVGRMHGGPKLR